MIIHVWTEFRAVGGLEGVVAQTRVAVCVHCEQDSRLSSLPLYSNAGFPLSHQQFYRDDQPRAISPAVRRVNLLKLEIARSNVFSQHVVISFGRGATLIES